MFSYVTIPSIRKYIVFCHFCIPHKGNAEIRKR